MLLSIKTKVPNVLSYLIIQYLRHWLMSASWIPHLIIEMWAFKNFDWYIRILQTGTCKRKVTGPWIKDKLFFKHIYPIPLTWHFMLENLHFSYTFLLPLAGVFVKSEQFGSMWELHYLILFTCSKPQTYLSKLVITVEMFLD